LLTGDPLREDVHRKLMRLHANGGRPGMAKRQYKRCREALEVDLGIAPSSETDALLTALATPACATMRPNMAKGQNAILFELHRTLSETQRSLAMISNRIDTLLYR
jgi:DNA-binding SARP family transcriptional activator